MKPLKILITAFAFEPCETSEPGVAWRFANIVAEKHDVYVITGGFPGPVERTATFLTKNPSLKITAIPFWPRGFPKSTGWNFINIHYWLWQRQIIRLARKLHDEIGFDLAHHLTLSRYWIGSSISALPISLIWGPVGSGGHTPSSFKKHLPFKARLLNAAREVSSLIFQRDPMLKKDVGAKTKVWEKG